MKRFLSLILALVFSLALCGCQKDETMQPGDVDEINRIPMEKLPTAKELIQNGGFHIFKLCRCATSSCPTHQVWDLFVGFRGKIPLHVYTAPGAPD